MSTEERNPDQTETESESTNTSLNSQDDTAPIGEDSASASGSRRLKRVPRTSGNSRYAKLNEDRKQQKAAGIMSKAEQFVGVSLADNRYQIVDRLGKGSMAYVFRAKDNRLETDVVVKIPKPEKLSGDEILERFRRESQLLVRLAHPHVVKVLDVGEYEKVPYVVMQLLSGGTLTDKMDAVQDGSRRMPVDSLKLWIREVARALDFCAKQGTVHRDVKPANILFDNDDNAYVSDFGLTKIMYGEHTALNSSETTTGVVLGTPNYIAPEIVLGQPYDGRADQYSLGITAYHTMCGRPPMQGNSATVTMINQTQKTLQLLSDIRSDVSRELALVIRKSLEKDPEKRFANCEEFAEAVTDALRGSSASSSSTAPVSAEPPAVRKIKRRIPPQSASQRSSRRKRPMTAPEPVAFDDYSSDASDWLDVADPLPPKRGGKKKTRKQKKKADVTLIQKHPRVLAGLGLAAVGTLTAGLLFFFSGGSEPEVTLADSVGASSDTRILNPYPGSSEEPDNSAKSGSSTTADHAAPPEDTQPPGNSKQMALAHNDSRQLAQPKNTDNSRNENTNPQPGPDGPKSSNPAASVANNPPTQPADTPTAAAGVNKSENGSNSVADVRTPFKTIPFEPGQKVTIGPATCPILVSGTTVWDKASGTARAQLDQPHDAQFQTVLSPDGKLFAAATKPLDQQNNKVIVWDTETGKQLFAAPGDGKRFTDIILLSSDSLFIGDRWSGELLVWNCSTGQKSKSINIEEARFKPGNATMSGDGKYIAVVARGRMAVVNAKDGRFVGVMQNPAESPAMTREPLLGNAVIEDLPGRGDREAEPIFMAMRSLQFSPDNQELAGFSNHPQGRMMCWNNVGKLIVDHATFRAYDRPLGNAALQWFDNREAWFVAGRLTDRNSGSVVMTTQRSDGSLPDMYVYDDDHLIGVLSSSPTQLSIIPIPWEKITTAISKSQNKQAGLLSRSAPVSVSVNLQPLAKTGSPEVDDLVKTFRSVVTREGLTIEQDQETTFSLHLASGAAARPILKRMTPPELKRPGTVSPDPGSEQFVVAELQLEGEPEPIWRVNLGVASDLGLHGGPIAVVDKLKRRINTLVVPYFIPRDENGLSLPIVLN